MSDLKPGDYVKIINQETVAEVLSVHGNDLEIGVGAMKVKIKRNKVVPTGRPEPSRWDNVPQTSGSGVDIKEKLHHFQFELDVRGKAREEIIDALNSWTDDAILLGIEQAKIIHGRGSGVLKDTVRSFLRKFKEVKSVGDEEGKNGDYVTIVKFHIS